MVIIIVLTAISFFAGGVLLAYLKKKKILTYKIEIEEALNEQEGMNRKLKEYLNKLDDESAVIAPKNMVDDYFSWHLCFKGSLIPEKNDYKMYRAGVLDVLAYDDYEKDEKALFA